MTNFSLTRTVLNSYAISLSISLIILFHTAEVTGAGGDFVWEHEADYSTIMTPAVSDGKVYMPVGTKFRCLDADTGSTLWEKTLNVFTWSSPSVSGEKVFFGGMNNATLYCLDAKTGAELWKFKDPTNSGSWDSPPAVWGDYVYSGSSYNKKLYCLSATDGSIIWEFETNLASNPVVSGGYVYTAGYNQDRDYVYYCLDGKTGALVWESEEISPIGYTPAVAGGYLFVGGYKLTCLNASTGAELWKTDIGALESTPAVIGSYVYINGRKKTYCFNVSNGEKVWDYESESILEDSQPVVTGNFVYSGARTPDKLICLNAATGALVFEYDAKDSVHTPSVDEGFVYFGIGDNSSSAVDGVFCVRAADGDTGSWPMFGCTPERTSASSGPAESSVTGIGVTGTPSTTSPVTFQVNTQDGSGTTSYRFSTHPYYGTSDYDGSHWTKMTASEYTTENTCSYTFNSTGKSIVVVWVTSSDTDNVDPTGIPIIGWSVDTSGSGCMTNFTGVTISGEQKVNQQLTFNVEAQNPCSNPMYYRFSMHPDYGTDGYDGTNWQLMTTTEWITDNSLDYTFTQTGKYIIVVWVSDTNTNVDPTGIPIIGWSVDIQ